MLSPKNLSTRAGRYVSQPEGYSAFVPAPLPPDPPVRIAGEIQMFLSEADRALGYLDGSVQTLPNPDLFVLMYVRKEAVLSSQIEGTQSSLQDLLAAEAEILAPDRPKDVDEVVNYVGAMNLGLSLLRSYPVSVDVICKIHERLLQGVRGSGLSPGKLRTAQNWIGYAGCTVNEAIFVPPPPHEVSRKLGELEEFFQNTDLPPLITVGIIHAQFETIHPFLDGNGRVGRLLISFLLAERKILQKPVLYLSHYLRKHRESYYNHLQDVRDRGDWEGWLRFFLRGIKEVSAEASATAGKILLLRERHRMTITENLGHAAGNGHRVLEYLYERPIISVKDVQNLIGVSYAAANNLVAQMVRNGILREFTGRARNRKFMYQDYVDLFHGTEPENHT